jgi:hypothetical protein
MGPDTAIGKLEEFNLTKIDRVCAASQAVLKCNRKKQEAPTMKMLKPPTRWLTPIISLIAILLYLLPACQSTPEATPTPTRTPRPPTLVPTTPAPIQVTTPTIAITPTPTPDPRVQTDFPPDVNPLTGEKMADPAVLNRRPLAVKISNYPPIVRPQQGLGQADLVFEHPAGRYLDLEIPQMYKAFFAYSGSSAGLKLKFKDANFFNCIVSPDFGAPESGNPFARIPQGDKAYEHTLFARPALIWRWAEAQGMDNSRQDLRGLAFSDAPLRTGKPAAKLVIPASAGDWAEQVEWQYDAAASKYLRSIEGTPHANAANGAQLAFANVILIYAPHLIDCTIQEDGVGFEPACNAGGHFSRQIQIWNVDPNKPGGKVQLLRDGQLFEGYWMRAHPSDMLTFYFSDGKPMPLKRGNSWFEMLPTDFAIQAQ